MLGNRRVATGVAVALFSAQSINEGCESHALTRVRSDGTDYRWVLVWIASILLVGLITWLTMRAVDHEATWLRRIASGAWLLPGVGFGLVAALFYALGFRRLQLESQFGGCREVPFAQRPRALVEIHCGGSFAGFDFGAGTLIGFFAGILLVIGVFSLATEKGHTLGWAVFSALVVLGCLYGAIHPGGRPDDVLPLLALAAYAAVPTACFFIEHARRTPD